MYTAGFARRGTGTQRSRKGRIGILQKNRNAIKEKIMESLNSVLPITVIVLILCLTVAPVPSGTMLAFLTGAVLLTVGMGLFTMGAEMAMSPIGERVGAHMTKSKNLLLIIVVSFLLGAMITISEPDLQVLAEQVPNIPNNVLIWSVALGVGVFLVIALLRIIFSVKLSYLLIGFYTLLFVFAIFVPADFLSIAFDSGGVTTGPMTVPFIMALGVGVASIRSDKHAGDDSFGLVAISSIGPILALMILGLVYKPDDSSYSENVIYSVDNSVELRKLFGEHLPHYLKEVAIALLPIIVFFFIYQALALKMHRRQLIRISVGLVYTYIGLVLFLTGVNIGFSPVGNLLGSLLAQKSYNWILIPIAMLMGYFVISAEPAVHVLNKQVEDITAGAIPSKAMNLSLSIGVSLSAGLAMVRVLTGLPIMYFLVPGYLIALVLTFFVPPIFTAIAFDSGGVASGPMTATFMLPFAMGACEALGGNIITDAFGLVALVAMTPLITIQIMGVVYNIKLKRTEEEEEAEEAPDAEVDVDSDIIEL